MGKHIEVRPVRPVTTDDWVRGGAERPVLAPVPALPEAAEMKRLTIDIPLAMHTRLKTEYGYLLDTTTPYMLWGDECRIRCRSYLYRLLCQPEKQLAS